MEVTEIENILTQSLELSFVKVQGDGSHFQVIAVGDCFAELSRIKRQQAVYAPLNSQIADGSIHALTIKTFTEEQWQRDKKLLFPDLA